MKNTLKVLGIIAMVALIGFSMVSCSDDDAGGGGKSPDGTWEGKNTYLGTEDNGANGKTFTVVISGDDITITGNDKELKGKLVDDPSIPTTPTPQQPGIDEQTDIYKDIKKDSATVGKLIYHYIKASAGGETYEEENLDIDIDPPELGGWVSLSTITGDLARK